MSLSNRLYAPRMTFLQLRIFILGISHFDRSVSCFILKLLLFWPLFTHNCGNLSPYLRFRHYGVVNIRMMLVKRSKPTDFSLLPEQSSFPNQCVFCSAYAYVLRMANVVVQMGEGRRNVYTYISAWLAYGIWDIHGSRCGFVERKCLIRHSSRIKMHFSCL